MHSTSELSSSADGTAASCEIFPVIEKKSAALRVLVVDDEGLIRWAIAETLTELGYSVIEAGDGVSALAILTGSSRPVDVILLDYRLPDSHNLSLLWMIRRLVPATQVVLMTAYGTPDVITRALDLGACRVISKPFEMGEIAAVVQQVHAGRPYQ